MFQQGISKTQHHKNVPVKTPNHQVHYNKIQKEKAYMKVVLKKQKTLKAHQAKKISTSNWAHYYAFPETEDFLLIIVGFMLDLKLSWNNFYSTVHNIFLFAQ